MKVNLFKRFKLNPIVLVLIIVVVSVSAYFAGIPFLDSMELKTIDLRFKSRGTVAPGDKVVLNDISELIVGRVVGWLRPRSKITALVKSLGEAGARVVAFDIGFLEPDDKRTLTALQQIEDKFNALQLRQPEVTQFLSGLHERANLDQQLAEAISKTPMKVALGYFFELDPKVKQFLDNSELRVHEQNIAKNTFDQVRLKTNGGGLIKIIEGQVPLTNIPPISQATPYAGFMNHIPDDDGVCRKVPMVIRYKEHFYPPLGLTALGAYLEAPLKVEIAGNTIKRLGIGSRQLPVDELGQMWVNYRGGPKTFPHVSVTDIIHGNFDKAQVADKLVLVGTTAQGLFDIQVTPFSSNYPGVEIHANVIDSILAGDYLYRPLWAVAIDLGVIIGIGLFLGIILARAGAVSGAFMFIGVFFGYILIALLLFARLGWIINLVYPLACIGLIYISITGYRYFVESRQKRFIRDVFSTYLAKPVVDQLIESGQKVELGGEERVITAFFSDVQGFTSISEKLTAKELVELLNEFLTEMTDIILANNGTVDKFEGDAIIAFFGAPNQLPNHADLAVKACIEMQRRLANMRKNWQAQHRPELFMRIGLNTGPAVVGNMGSRNRMDYTMMGDTVNTAARLEGINKVYGTYTLISESTRSNIDNAVALRELDLVKVVGRTEPLRVYEVIGYYAEINDKLQETLRSYQKGLEAYRQRNWDLASHCFGQALQLTPNDKPSQVMRDRVNEYMSTPPPDAWLGAYSAIEK